MKTRAPLPPPFPMGTRLRCIKGHDAYVSSVERPRDRKDHPEDWVRVTGQGIEVTIARVELGRRGTGRQLHDEDGPIVLDDGEPLFDETQDGYSVYQIVRGEGIAAKMSGRCIFSDSAYKWQVLSATPVDAPDDPTHFKQDEIIKEGADLGVILQSGAVAYDVIWTGGSTSRYRYDAAREIHAATAFDLEGQDGLIKHLREEAEAARKERRSGARIKRGHVHPSR